MAKPHQSWVQSKHHPTNEAVLKKYIKNKNKIPQNPPVEKKKM
jgi:hypothetical protein